MCSFATMNANILIVDDMPDNLRLLMEILKQRSYKVRPALDGFHALNAAHSEPPDVILLDAILPGMDGYQVCEQLKADCRTSDIPVIFISALNSVFDKVKAFSLGAVDYISKPFQAEEVLARVETHLTMRKLQQDLQQEIGRRKQVEEQLRERNQQLLETNASKDKFFSILAHDLRSPVGMLLEMYDVILENIEQITKEKLMRLLHIEHDTAHRLMDLLENLLAWARSQQKTIEFSPQPLDLRELITANMMLLSPKAQKKQICLNNQVQQPLVVAADRQMLNSVVANLLSNAVKFTGSQGSVNISAAPNERQIEVSVADTGIGIPPEIVPTLFRIDAVPFRRSGTANESSAGFGLVLCKEFVERHGGRIWIESDSGKGTTVRFTLPVS